MGQVIQGSQAIPSYEKRYQEMERVFSVKGSTRELLNAASFRFTVQSMAFCHERGRYGLFINFDEQFAGGLDKTFLRLDLDCLF